MKAYQLKVGNDVKGTYLAESDTAMFDRIARLIDAEDKAFEYLRIYNSSVSVIPLGEVK